MASSSSSSSSSSSCFGASFCNNNGDAFGDGSGPFFGPLSGASATTMPRTTQSQDAFCTSSFSSLSSKKRQIDTNGNNTSSSFFKKDEKDDTQQETSDTIDLVAQELNALSFEERERLYDEIHGVAQMSIQETPEFVQDCIQQLDEVLQNLPRTSRMGIERAIFLRPSIETDVRFKLSFLRADEYNARKAARRLAKYFDDKMELFGNGEKLVKDITLDDLSAEDLEVLEIGAFVPLPHKDRAGRRILFTDVSKMDYSRNDNMIRVCWYSIMSQTEDDDAQIKGVSVIQCCLGDWKLNVPFSQFSSSMTKAGNVLPNLPVRPTSYHFCYSNPAMNFISVAFQKLFGKNVRLRFRSHYGTALEVQYSLMTYGISVPLIGTSSAKNNNNDNDHAKKYSSNNDNDNGHGETMLELLRRHINRRRQLERERQEQQVQLEQETGIILYPKTNDILVGRGRPYQNYTGNVLLLQIIQRQTQHQQQNASSTTSYFERLQETSEQFEKTCIYMEIVATLQNEYGSRFLERVEPTTQSKKDYYTVIINGNSGTSNHQSGGGWKIVEDAVARKKVANAYRNLLAKDRKNNGNKLELVTTTMIPPNNNNDNSIINYRHSHGEDNEDTTTATNNNDLVLYSPTMETTKDTTMTGQRLQQQPWKRMRV